MPASRRTFLRNLGLASAGMLAPSLFLNSAHALGSAHALAGTRDLTQVNSGFKIVENGAARAVIVVAHSASSVPQYAVQELQWHIEKATSARLAIVAEQDAAASALPRRIYVGMSDAAKKAGMSADDSPANGFHSKTTADAIYFAGKDDRGRSDDPPFSGWKNHFDAHAVAELSDAAGRNALVFFAATVN